MVLDIEFLAAFHAIPPLGVPLYLAGCADAAAMTGVAKYGVEDVLLGKAIYAAQDVTAAARELHAVASAL